MSRLLEFIILGIATGAVYTLPAQGLVLIYRGSGVLNFAQGAIGMVGAYVFYDAGVQHGWPVGVSLVVGLLASAAVAAVMHFGLMVPLRRASPLVRVVATLGVMFFLLALGTELFGYDPKLVGSPLPHANIDILGAHITEDRLYLIGIALLITVLLDVGMRKLNFGRATQAVAENSTALAAMGYSPDLVAATNWALGGALAGAGAILIAPILTLQPSALILVSLRALAAALVGRFRSFRWTMAAAVAIGISESLLAEYVAHSGVFKPLTNASGYLANLFSGQALSESVAFIVIIAIMAIGGRALPLRGTLFDRLPALGDGLVRWRQAALGLAVLIVILGVARGNWAEAVTISLSTGIILASIVVVTGYMGQISLAQAAFAGIGMWVAGRLYAAHGWPFLLALLAAVVVAVPVGLLAGLPAVRQRGVNLAVVTFGLAICVGDLILTNPQLTGGYQGTRINNLSIAGISIDPFAHPIRYGAVVSFFLVLVLIMIANLRRSVTGRQLIAIRGNERAAGAMGINVASTKLFAFALAAAIAALGGVLLGFLQPTLNFSAFTNLAGVNMIVYTVLGGVGFVVGPLIGGTLAPGGVGAQLFSTLGVSGSLFAVIAGGLLILSIVGNPDGVAHTLRRFRIAKGAPRVELNVPENREARAVPARTLTLRDVSVKFGGVTAVDAVSVDICPGEVVGIIGPNGAGKTTLLDAITGYAPVAAGSIELDGVALTRLAVHRRKQLGVARSFQQLELFEDLSVGLNIVVACEQSGGWRRLRDLVKPGKPALTPEAYAALSEVGLLDVTTHKPQDLPQGQRRAVAVARAAAAWPSVLLLDEPAAGLNGSDSDDLGALIRRLAHDYGMAVGLIEHDMDLVMSVCDRIVVLDSGRKVASGTPAEIQQDPVVIAAYLGVAEPTAMGSTA